MTMLLEPLQSVGHLDDVMRTEADEKLNDGLLVSDQLQGFNPNVVEIALRGDKIGA